MDFEYDVMASVNDFCNTNIDDIIAANEIEESPNDSQEMAQLLGIGVDKKLKTQRKQKITKKKSKTTENDTAIPTSVKDTTIPTQKSKNTNLQSDPVDSDIPSDDTFSDMVSDDSSEIYLSHFEKNSQRGRARRNYLSELASRVPTVDSLDLTIQNPPIQTIVPDYVSTARPLRSGRQHQQNSNRQRNNNRQQQRQSNVICIGSDEEDNGAIFEPITINNRKCAGILNISYSNLNDENPEYSVKIEWLNKIEEFPLRKYQKFLDIFEILAKRENTDIHQIFLNLDSKIIEPNDTPASINYFNFDIISGRVVKNNKSDVQLQTKVKKDINQICVKLQSNVWKKHLSISINKTDKFQILYIKCSEELKLPFDKFTLLFDGEHLTMHQTANDLNLEDGEIIDCVVKK